jgi:putative transposase
MHTPHDCYLSFQPDAERRFISYRSFVASPSPDGMDEQIHYAAISGKPLGSEEFRERIKAKFGDF